MIAAADQDLGSAAVRLAQKLPVVALAVAHDHGPGAGAGARQLLRPLEPVQPAPALRRAVVAPEVGVARLRMPVGRPEANRARRPSQ